MWLNCVTHTFTLWWQGKQFYVFLPRFTEVGRTVESLHESETSVTSFSLSLVISIGVSKSSTLFKGSGVSVSTTSPTATSSTAVVIDTQAF